MDDSCPIPYDRWHCVQWLVTTALDQVLHSASMGEGYLFPYFSHLARSFETHLSAANSLCVCKIMCKRVENCKSEKYKGTAAVLTMCLISAKSISHNGVAVNTVPTTCYLSPKAKVAFSVHCFLFFRLTSLRKEQRCFPKEWTAFCHLFQTWFKGNTLL